MNKRFARAVCFILTLIMVSTLFSCTTPEDVNTDMAKGDYLKKDNNYFYVSPERDASDIQKQLINLYNTCDNANQAFLYAALPVKSQIFGISEDKSYEYEAAIAEALDKYFIDALHPSDFDNIEKSDFRITDGSFNAEGSFKIYERLVSALDELYTFSYGVPSSVWDKANDKSKYEKIVMNDAFSGEYSKAFPEGTDDAVSYQTEEYSVLSTKSGSFSVRYTGGEKPFSKSYATFNEAVINTNEALRNENGLDYVLSKNHPAIKIVNAVLDLKITVLHNLSDLSPIAFLSQNVGVVNAFDILNSKDMTASEFVSENTDSPIVILLIDPSRPVTNLHKGKNVENQGIVNKSKAIRTSTREVVPYIGKVDVTDMANNLIELENKIRPMGADIIYVSAPSKYIEGYTILPEGVEHYCNDNIDNFLEMIDGKVDYIDCRELFKEQKYPEEKWFYTTDHHWREESAFQAYIGCIEKLRNDYGWTDVDPNGRNTDRSNFNFELFTDYYVGSQTRELNRYYLGYDDFFMVTPKFATSLTYRRTPENGGMVRKGNYYEALIDQKYLDLSDPKSNKYASYIGGDHHSNKITNDDPTCSDKRVLIVEDSFSLPFDCYMSLNFKELNIIDIRFYSLRTISSFVKAYDIDMVIIVYTPEALYSRQVQFKFK
ncbi:MAG: hypothetical protein E7665_02130 [Ruminococcaceae bacterium]|nr:hypothetical protein [Oscillospiraceae bacterium]